MIFVHSWYNSTSQDIIQLHVQFFNDKIARNCNQSIDRAFILDETQNNVQIFNDKI